MTRATPQIRRPACPTHPAHEALYARLVAYSPDAPDAALPFSKRLAQREGWSHAHALRVIDEYRRFVFLSRTAGHVATPSRAIDAAWHLHLEYTREYWSVFCDQVLGAPLHHEPGKGGADEDALYESLYLKTLDSYAAAFGEAPPDDIWPRPAAERDEDEDEADEADGRPARRGLVERMRVRVRAVAASYDAPRVSSRGVGVAAMVLALTSCAYVGSVNVNVFDYAGPDFLRFFAMLCVGVLVLLWGAHRVIYRYRRFGLWQGEREMPGVLRAHATSGGPQPLPHEVAYMRHGVTRMVHVAALEMMQRGLITIDRKSGKSAHVEICNVFDGGPFAGELEWLRLTKNGRSTYAALCRQLALREAGVRDRMRNAGWWWARGDMAGLRIAATALCLLVLGVGGAKVAVGLVRGRPVDLLVVGLFAFYIAYRIVRARLTGVGRGGMTLGGAAVAQPIAGYRGNGSNASNGDFSSGATANPDAVLWQAAIIGSSALAGTEWAGYESHFAMPVRRVLPAAMSGGSGGGSSSSCSSHSSCSSSGGSSSCSSSGGSSSCSSSSCGGCSSS